MRAPIPTGGHRGRGGFGRLALLVLLTGCAATVRVRTLPSGASLTLADGSVLSSPTEIELRRPSGGPVPIAVSLEGYRPVTIDLRRLEGRLLRWIGGATQPKLGRELTVVLVPAAVPVSAPPP